ncbi:thioredoxin family protein [Marinifilum caeruleilacunae]|uniref:Thioredoxin family protein n=1 Tax=Marinifilum caeruleilacunae TaxID=2499076 RepID=A0ABX1WQ63_9BACT|nr:thioredoxin family protein [Marinifilum caeruleilacunae]NOU58227.1 thioredoxin family protein [Marinifilum caeruleilacunae]
MKTIKLILVASLMLFLTNIVMGQKIYNPQADAKKDILEAVAKAKKEGKHVLIQVGGNWCPWCIKMHKYLHGEEEITKLLNDNYIFLEVNYSKENKNKEVLKDLGFPQRFGFPVMLVLDEQGNRLHTQSTGNLEKDKGYDFDRVKSFLYNWRPDALNPAHYK